MKKVAAITILLCTGLTVKGQDLQRVTAKDFYLHLRKVIKKGATDSIKLEVFEYGCLGSESRWKADIIKIDEMVKIDFYTQKLDGLFSPVRELDTILDTTFITKKDMLIKNLKTEIKNLKSRPVFMEGSLKVSLENGNSTNNFLFRKGDKLYHLLRYNKPFPIVRSVKR